MRIDIIRIGVNVSVGIALAIGAGTPAFGQSRRALNDLGRLTPPAYGEPLVRIGDSAPVFDEAMRTYRQKQYVATADLLRRFAAAEPDDPAGNFFLAVSLMMTDEVGEAEDRLGAVLAAGQTPFERAARFVLAKAAIRLNKLDVAERELALLADGADHFALDAAGLLPRVRALKKR
jgi:predicted Zn-dependent protease